ncbi:hypothetical protein C8R44DRAFT_342411 [Mycena epipterygia]|nr:hypothetical protein C8R44DRAFT_342411 [Mycena epipterygia]
MFRKIVFSPVIRMYNMRAVLLVTAFFLPTQLIAATRDEAIPGFVGSVAIMCHQAISIFAGRNLYAAVDMALVLAEIGVLIFDYKTMVAVFLPAPLSSIIWVVFVISLQLGTLALSALFRACSLWASPEKLYKQQFSFFGGCPQHQQTASPFRILLGRSMWRPLVR